MLKHIVMWQFKKELDNVKEYKANIKEHLEALVDIIPELKSAKVITEMEETSTHDIALISEVEDMEALKRYAAHPAHVKVANEDIIPFVENRVCIDFFE